MKRLLVGVVGCGESKEEKVAKAMAIAKARLLTSTFSTTGIVIDVGACCYQLRVWWRTIISDAQSTKAETRTAKKNRGDREPWGGLGGRVR
jgi:hypothetical protein